MSLVVLLSGPNLNLLGEREPAIYGTETLDAHVDRAEAAATRHGLTLEHLQSNHEGALVEAAPRGRCTTPSPLSRGLWSNCISRIPPPGSPSGTRRSWPQ
jgi:hypothetical protein